MRYSAQDVEKEQEEFKWLEEKMKQESEEIEIPESLSPEKMLEKLKQLDQQEEIEESYPDNSIQNENLNQKHQFLKNGKRILIAAATFTLVAGVSWQVGKIAHFSSTDEDCSAVESVECEDAMMDSVEITESEVLDGVEAGQEQSKESVQESTQEKTQEDVPNSKGFDYTLASPSEDTTTDSAEAIEDSENQEYGEDALSERVEYRDGTYNYEGEANQVIIKKGDQEVTQLTLEQDVKYILRYARILICITSDGVTTSICTFSVDDFEHVEHPQMTGTVSIEASYEGFYMEGSTLSIITGEGKDETFDIREIQGE